MDESNKFIEKQLADDKKIIVHCMAGISRSVSLVLSYLMYKYKMSYEKALATVRKNRPIANPNEGFMRQLRKKYEYTGMGEIVTGIGKYN
jgi:protein-tyrosine phosphatase